MSLSWIPQLFYDLLARLLPGVVLLVIAAILAKGGTGQGSDLVAWFWAHGFGYYGSPAAALGCAYVLGVVLAEIWEIVVRRHTQDRKKVVHDAVKAERLREHNTLALGLGGKKAKIMENQLPSILAMQEHLRPVSTGNVLRLLRLRSDLRLCHVAFVGFIVLLLFDIVWSCINGVNGARISLGIALPLCALALFRRAERLERFIAVATCVAWLERVMEGGLQVKDNGRDQPTESN